MFCETKGGKERRPISSFEFYEKPVLWASDLFKLHPKFPRSTNPKRNLSDETKNQIWTMSNTTFYTVVDNFSRMILAWDIDPIDYKKLIKMGSTVRLTSSDSTKISVSNHGLLRSCSGMGAW